MSQPYKTWCLVLFLTPYSPVFSSSFWAGSVELDAWLSFSTSSSCSFFWFGLDSRLEGFSGLSPPMLLRGDSISISSPQSDTGWWLSSGEKGLRGLPPSGDSWAGAGEGMWTFGLGVRCSLGLPADVVRERADGDALELSLLLADFSFPLSFFSSPLESGSEVLPSSCTTSSSSKSLASSHSSSSSSAPPIFSSA